MQQMSSTQAKQSFGELLEAAERGPVAIEKHHKIKAIVASPAYFENARRDAGELADRRAARVQQGALEKDRLIKHQRIAIDLLTLPAAERAAVIDSALDTVHRWRTEGLCSQDYIEKWQALLQLAVPELARAMTSDLDGWGVALRQNSPWATA